MKHKLNGNGTIAFSSGETGHWASLAVSCDTRTVINMQQSLAVDTGLLEQSVASSDGQFHGQSAPWLAFHTLRLIIGEVQAWAWWTQWHVHMAVADQPETEQKLTELHWWYEGDRTENGRSRIPFLHNWMEQKHHRFYPFYSIITAMSAMHCAILAGQLCTEMAIVSIVQYCS